MRGFSLLELLIAFSIIVGMTGVGLPFLMADEAQQQLQRVMQKQLSLLQQARALALKHQQSVIVRWQGMGDNWCIHIALTNETDCLKNAEISTLKHTDAHAVLLSQINFAKGSWTAFDGELGLSQGHGGSVSFAVDNLEVKLIISSLGRFRLCVVSGEWLGYRACS